MEGRKNDMPKNNQSRQSKQSKRSKHYKVLRDYVKNSLEITSTEIEEKVADAISMSEKTIQNICSGLRDFKWNEAKKVARFFFELCKDNKDVDISVLKRLLYDFLLHSAITDAEADIDQKTVLALMESITGSPYVDDEEKINKVNRHSYSNLPKPVFSGSIIREKKINDIISLIKNGKIIFLSGFPGTGKTFVANAVAHKLYDADECVAIWISCSSGNVSYNAIISIILATYNLQNAGNLSREEKEQYAQKCLSEGKSIIVIDGFENVEGKNEKEKIFAFLSKNSSENTIILITCNQRISFYRDIIERPYLFCEVPVENFTLDEWKRLSKSYSESRSDICEAKKIIPDLDEYVFSLCKGNPFLMTHVLSSVAEKILTGVGYTKIKNEYNLSDVDPKSYNTVLRKSILDLSDNSVKILVSLSLFVSPISLQVLSQVSGLSGVDLDGNLIDNSDLSISILKCHNLFLIDRYFSNSNVMFSIAEMVRPIIENERILHKDEYSKIVYNWISYYINFSQTIGFCFDDFNRLSALDKDQNAREIDNIIVLLEYCEREEMWREYYTVSENTKYFFYTRGISGEGKRSVHYRRANAARNLKDYKSEFESLLYHCNVSCKTKSMDSVPDCFIRMDEILSNGVVIPNNSLLKYKYIKALYSYFSNDIEAALVLFEEYEREIKERMMDCQVDKLIIHDYVASLRWHCECVYSSLSNRSTDDLIFSVKKVYKMLDEAVTLAQSVNFERAIVHSIIIRIKFFMLTNRDIEEICELIKSLDNYTNVIKNDALYTREYNNILKKYNMAIKGGK